MMNTANSTINTAPNMKPGSVGPMSQSTQVQAQAAPPPSAISLQPSGIIPIITSDRLTNSASNLIPPSAQNHEHSTQAGPRTSLTTFTIHTPSQPGGLHSLSTNPANVSVASSAQNQIQTAASIIHSGGLSLPGSANPMTSSSVMCSIIPSTVPVATIPGGVRSVSVLSTKPPPAISGIAPRFQTAGVIPTNGPQTGQSINLLIHHSDHLPPKNLLNVTHSAQHHLQTANPTGTVVKAGQNPAGAILTSTNTNASAPLYIQTNQNLLNSAQNILPPSATQVNAPSLSNITITTSQTQHPQASSQPPVRQQQSQQQATQFPTLKVEDALSYLDQVKLRFNDQPQVYNDFLDIMKEFKSQSIDTPGVIHRVSTLFKGHPELIVGFNTFLPPGYKIELRANEVNVSTPNSSNILLMTSGGSFIQGQSQHIGHATIANTLQQNGIMSNVTNLQQNHQAFINTEENNYSSRPTIISGKAEAFNDFNVSNRQQKGGHRTHNNSESNNSVKTGGAEFNNAIAYVNKIKTRFHARPDVYKEFLDILQSFQNNPDNKSTSDKIAHEKIIFEKVAVLFEDHTDLLEEFNQFLPDSTATRTVSNSCNKPNSVSSTAPASYRIQSDTKPQPYNQHHQTEVRYADKFETKQEPVDHHSDMHSEQPNYNQVYTSLSRGPKRTNASLEHGTKRSKLVSQRDSSFAEAGKFVGEIAHYAIFDKIRAHLNCQKSYENFLRCLSLYTQEIISKTELIQALSPFLNKVPELFKRFKDIVNIKEPSLKNNISQQPNATTQPSYLSYPNTKLEGLSSRIASMNRNDVDYVEIDVNSCKRYGASYRTIPKTSARQECSGRTPLCHEVLNDTLVSFPTWSEDSTFVSSKKINYEEYLTRCEDERYELDQVLETNLATIRVFNNLVKKIEKMTPEEKQRFKLDDNLGGRSEVIHQKAIKRIYGDKASGVIEGLKNAPAQIVPIVYRRLLTKEEEWREAQKAFNKLWREQYEKYYLKSLDHQGVNFKQNDIKNLKPKSLFNEIENALGERQKELETDPSLEGKPHIIFQYPDKSMINVACNLIIHHVKRQTSINKEDKQKVKQLMKHFIPDLFGTCRGDLSDDEGDAERESESKMFFNLEKQVEEDKIKPDEERVDVKPLYMMNQKGDDQYALFFNNELWYCFFRYHYILCERLSKMHKETEELIEQKNRENSQNKKSFAYHLALKSELNIKTEDYFKSLIDMVKQVLDGNLETTQYEDTLREMYGIKAYISFTLDKLVQSIVKQLQGIVSDDVSSQCVDMYLEALKINAAGGSCTTSHKRAHQEAIYQKVAEQLLIEEYCFKLVVYRDQGLLTYEYLPSPDIEDDDDSANDNEEESVSTQSSRTTRSTMKGKSESDAKFLEKVEKRVKDSPLFLGRLIEKYKSQNNDEIMKKTSSDDGSNDRMDVDDDAKSQSKDECELNLDSYNSVLIIHNDIKSKNSLLYRRLSLKNAQKTHKTISSTKHSNFNRWHEKWSEKNCKESESFSKLLKR